MTLSGNHGIRAYRGMPTFRADFMQGALDSRMTFARASNGWYFNSSGVLTQASSNTPRFDYNPSTLALNGLLIEPSATNALLQSNSFATIWADYNATIAQNATGPDGLTSAWTLTPTAQYGGVTQSLSLSGSTSYTLSLWMKAGTSVQGLNVGWYDGTNYHASTITPTSTWTRYVIPVGTTVATPSGPYVYIDTSNASPSGSFLIYGAQLEVGNVATSYIPTTSSAVTRAGDNLTNTSIPWFSATAGSFATEFMVGTANTAASATVALFDDGTSNNLIKMYVNTTPAEAASSSLSGTATNSAALATVAANTPYKMGISYVSGSNQFVNGTTVAGSTSWTSLGEPSGLSALRLGVSAAGNTQLNGWLRRFSYWNHTLTNSQLQQVTT
ncbi:MAG: hypothetical protein WCD70_14180 [Alphaproteobacteria bacterium]